MAVTDLWTKRDGLPSARHGRGLRYRVAVPGYPSKSFRTKRPAEQYEARLIIQGPPKPRDTTTVAELVGLWRAGKAGLSRKGLEAVQLAAAAVTARWGAELACEVEQHEVQAWIAAVPRSASWKHKAMQCLRGALTIGLQKGVLVMNPAVGVTVPKEVPREGRFLTVPEIGALADKAGAGSAMIWLMATTGIRIGEACALTVGDVMVKRGRLRVRRAKTQAGVRDVAVPPRVLAKLDLSRPAGEPLFLSATGRRVAKDNWRRRVFAPAVAAAGMDDLRPHDLRHTAASLMIDSGASVKDVQAQLGHKRASMTLDLYSHLFDRGVDDVAARMDGLLSD
jgi:integrase